MAAYRSSPCSWTIRVLLSGVVLAASAVASYGQSGRQESAAAPVVGDPLPEERGVKTTLENWPRVDQDPVPQDSVAPARPVQDVPVQESPSDAPAAPSLLQEEQPSPEESAVEGANVEAKEQAEDEAKKQKELAAKLCKEYAEAYKPVFYNNNFSYLSDPAWNCYWIGDCWKQRCLCGQVRIDVGGEFRFRLDNERNMRGLGLTGLDDDFGLYRTRIFANAQLTQNLRVYAEFIDAESSWEDYAPRAIEVNRADMLNLFVDGVLYRDSDSMLTARVGRQELLYGDQRLVSPLDWANTRRTFDGVKFLWARNGWEIDSFWTRPVPVIPDRFDSSDENQQFMGIYGSYRGTAGPPRDYYVLRQTNTNVGQGFEFNTIGTRQTGEFRGWQTLGEFAYQFGNNRDGSDHSAGMATVGTGRKLSDSSAQPTLWFYYDYASGGDDLGAVDGFYHHFPLGHKYLGFMDFYGRSNIEDFNFTFTWKPAEKLQMLLWYHYFTLATASDTPYSVVMTPFNPGNAPGSVRLGQEVDLLATWSFHPRQEMQFGYSHFFAGAYYETTPGVPFNGDADFFYTQYQIRF